MFVKLSPIVAAAGGGELFRKVLPIALAGVVVVMALHLVVSLIYRGAGAERAKWNLWDVLIYLATLGCVGILAATSLVEVLRHGELGGWALFLHMFGAGAFTAVLPLLALSWADANRLEFRTVMGNQPRKFSWLPKLMFWVILASGLVVTMTMLLSMLPIYGSDGLHLLLDLHRYSGLVVVLAVILHFYGVVVQRVVLR